MPLPTRLGCLSGLLSFAGALFSVCTVLINLADVASDVYVAIQFRRDGDAVWFWLVVSSLVIAHLVYTAIGVHFLRRQDAWDWLDRWHWSLRLLLWLPIAQLLPLLNLVMESAHQYGLEREATRQRRQTEREAALAKLQAPNTETRDAADAHTPFLVDVPQKDEDRPSGQPPPPAPKDRMAGVIEEELEGVAASRLVAERMQKALQEHLMKYGLFYVESAVEAAPQAIIQLLAITFLGRASPAQLVSLCCSLFSITSKGFVIAQAYDARVMVFKFALAAHDVFSTFYLFSTLVARETHKDTDFFGLEVSWLGYVWLWKLVVYAGFALVTGLGVFLSQVAYSVMHRNFKDRLKEFAVMVAVFLGAFGPGLLCLEACKLTWYTIFAIAADDGEITDTKNALASAFIASGGEDVEERRRHILRSAIAHTVYCHESHGRAEDKASQQAKMAPVKRKPYADQVRHARRLLQTGDWHNLGYLAHECTGYQAAAAPATFYRPLWDALDETDAPLTTNALALFTYRAWGVHVEDLRRERNDNVWWSILRATYVKDAKKRFPIGWCAMLGCVLFLGQIISVAYPFANAARQFGSHNLLQATCFYATCAALLLALVTLPWAVRAYRFDMTVKRVISSSSIGLDEVLAWVADFHEPPHVACLQEAVAVAVLPAEVTAVAGAFLSPGDVGLGALTVAECTALRRRLAARGGLIVRAAGIDIPGGDAVTGAEGLGGAINAVPPPMQPPPPARRPLTPPSPTRVADLLDDRDDRANLFHHGR